MSAIQHTPGPWKIEATGYLPCVGIHAEYEPDGLVALLPEMDTQNDGGSDENTRDANARLIAAAPELLDVARLSLFRAECDLRMWPVKSLESVEHQSLTTFANKLRNAIAKAEGRA